MYSRIHLLTEKIVFFASAYVKTSCSVDDKKLASNDATVFLSSLSDCAADSESIRHERTSASTVNRSDPLSTLMPFVAITPLFARCGDYLRPSIDTDGPYRQSIV